jgi:acyl CoA:acetate/3-ketoacid CoA transferase alpha subunit
MKKVTEFDAILESTFALRENEGQNKMVSLEEAIRRHIRPGMEVQFHKEANASLMELTRQFWGTKPQFTFICYALGNHAIAPVHGGLVKKLITTNCSHLYPTPGPIRTIQQCYREKSVEIENWSFYSLQQRFMAGAMGVGFLPTRSILGTTMAEENQDSFREMEDPFGSGEKLGLVKALSPDVSLVHGWAADPYGNTILFPPYEELWGARASKNGAVVTVERIVSADFLRRYSHWVKLPGYLVSSVSLAPLGAHPWGIAPLGPPEVEGYREDYEFMLDLRRVSGDAQAFQEWIEQWVLGVGDHQGYLRKLGEERIARLKERGQPGAWRQELEELAHEVSPSPEYNGAELMVVAAARQIKEKVLEKGYRTILAGAGACTLSAWLAYFLLRKEGYHTDLLVGSGQMGYTPRPGDPTLTSTSHTPTSKFLAGCVEIYGMVVAGEKNQCISSLGAGQIDRFGNVNATRTERAYLVGSGGGNDAVNGRETVITLRQSRDRFVDRVPYITFPGERIRTLVSDLGVFEKVGGDAEFTLVACLPNDEAKDLEDRIGIIREKCGWDLKVAQKVEEMPPPTLDELITLRLMDPRGFFISD